MTDKFKEALKEEKRYLEAGLPKEAEEHAKVIITALNIALQQPPKSRSDDEK